MENPLVPPFKVVLYRQASKRDRVDQLQDRGVSADAERESQQCGGGETGCLDQTAESVTEIEKQRIHAANYSYRSAIIGSILAARLAGR